MGMYTQVRGWLNVDSIGDYDGKNYTEIGEKLEKAKQSFLEDTSIRSWVCQDTIAHKGGNGSVYLFFGTELKNYDEDAEQWIQYLLQFFPNAQGRIDFQYEEERPDDQFSTSKFWFIRDGMPYEESCKTWCKGYGNTYN